MKKAALFAIPIFLSGCSGLGKSFYDTLSLPGGNPNMPKGKSETIDKVMGRTYLAVPILPESGNIWPGAPQPLPTLRDVEASPNSLRDALADPNSYFGSMTKSHGAGRDSAIQLGDGETLLIGEHDNIVNGVRAVKRPSLSSSVEDNAHKFITPGNGETIEIPNGDGTTTLISPDGVLRVIKDRPAGH